MKELAAELQKMGVENVIAAPALWIGNRGSRIEGVKRSEGEGGVRVWRFRCSESPGDLGEIYGEGDPVAAESFKKVLNAEKPDIAHFHAWSPAVSILLVREVKRRGIRIVQTYHTPTLSCPRGTLMRWGKVVCDGDLARRPCALCAIHGKFRKGYGIGPLKPTPAHPSHLLRNLKEGHLRGGIEERGEGIKGGGEVGKRQVESASIPDPLSAIQNAPSGLLQNTLSKLTTMLRMPALIRKRTEAVRELFRTADKIVALNQWTKELLRVNGVEESKVEVIRHGIPDSGFRIRDSGINKQSAEGIGPLRLAPAHWSPYTPPDLCGIPSGDGGLAAFAPAQSVQSLRDAGEIRLRGGIADSGEGIGGINAGSRKDAKDAEGMEEIQDIGYRISDIGSTKDAEQKKEDNGKALKLVFLGRVAPEKGIDVLLRAMEMVKIPVELDVYGIGAKGDSGERIGDRGSNKVKWLESVKPEKVVETIGKYDALVVPSVWLETGPLVVLEAFAAGVPVIGSRLGGIAEMVEDGADGVLFQPGDPAALAIALEKFSEKQSALKGNIKKPKEVRRVAEEHYHLYRSLV